ncbi:MAG: hypothetical protein EOM20_06755 [Spartobacteria bacterium]|nr:hypothetical protein [Spartobacteria bacterium]
MRLNPRSIIKLALALAWLFGTLLYCLHAQELDAWRIARTNDVSVYHTYDAIAWPAGDSVQYDLWVKRNSATLAIPTNCAPVWYVTDSTLTNFYIQMTGTIANATNGHIRFVLSHTNSALNHLLNYQSVVRVFQGADTNVIIARADRASVKILWNPDYNGTLIQPRTNLTLNADTIVDDYFWAIYSNAIWQAISGAEDDPIYRAASNTLAADIAGRLDSNTWAASDSTTNYVRRTEGTPLYAETDPTWSAASNTLAADIAARLASNTWAAADSTTNYVPRTDGIPLYSESDPVWETTQAYYRVRGNVVTQTPTGANITAIGRNGGTIEAAGSTYSAPIIWEGIGAGTVTQRLVMGGLAINNDPIVTYSALTAYSTGAPVYVESDPSFEFARANGFEVRGFLDLSAHSLTNAGSVIGPGTNVFRLEQKYQTGGPEAFVIAGGSGYYAGGDLILTNGYAPAGSGPGAVRAYGVSTISGKKTLSILTEDAGAGGGDNPGDIYIRPGRSYVGYMGVGNLYLQAGRANTNSSSDTGGVVCIVGAQRAEVAVQLGAGPTAEFCIYDSASNKLFGVSETYIDTCALPISNRYANTPLIAGYFTLTQETYTATALPELATALVVTNEDRVESFFTSYVHRAYQLVPELLYATNNDFTISTDATNVTIDHALLRVSFADTNAADVTIAHSDYERTVTLVPRPVANYTNRYIHTGITGSLRYAMTDGFDDALARTGTAVYVTQSPGTTNYIRNTNCWAYGLMDLTCASPWNSLYDGYRAGTAITPQHIAYAKHYPLATGTVVRFVDATNAVHDRAITDIRYPASDIAIAMLNTPLPGSIVPAKILLKSGIADYLPPTTTADARRSDTGSQIPCAFFNRAENIYCGQWYTGADELAQNESIYISYLHTNRSARYSVPVSGDSGNPVLAKAGTNTVLLTCWYTAQYGPAYKYHAESIAAALTDMGATQTLSYITYIDDYDQVATNGPPSP